MQIRDSFDLSKELEAAGVVNTVKMVVIPKEKDVLFFRLENLADLDSGVGTIDVNLQMVADAYQKVASTTSRQFEIVETSITGNMKIEEMRARKTHWKTAHQSVAASNPIEIVSAVSLKPLEIRAFLVDYSNDGKLDEAFLA